MLVWATEQSRDKDLYKINTFIQMSTKAYSG